MECPEGFLLTTFQVLYNVSTHWPILLCNPHFCKIQFVNKFESTSSEILREYIPPHDFTVEQGHSASLSAKIWPDLFLKKIFMEKRGTNFFGKTYERTVGHGGLMIRSCQGQESFTNAFSSNLKTVNLAIFPNYEGINTWK